MDLASAISKEDASPLKKGQYIKASSDTLISTLQLHGILTTYSNCCARLRVTRTRGGGKISFSQPLVLQDANI